MSIYKEARPLTKGELCEAKGLDDLEDASYDIALPQDWLDEAVKYCKLNGYPISYHEILYGTVWMYDKQSRIFGRPYPLTCYTHYMIEKVLPSRLFGKGDH